MASPHPEGYLWIDDRGPRRRKSSRELAPVDDDEKTPKASAEARAAPPARGSALCAPERDR